MFEGPDDRPPQAALDSSSGEILGYFRATEVTLALAREILRYFPVVRIALRLHVYRGPISAGAQGLRSQPLDKRDVCARLTHPRDR